jgi:hypothetical protein
MQGLEETALVDENLPTALKAMASGVASGVGRFYVFGLHRCIAINSSHDWQDAMDPLLNELLKSSHSLPATSKEALNRFILPDGSWDRDKLCITSGKPFAGLQEHDHLGWVQRIFGANLPIRCRNSALNHRHRLYPCYIDHPSCARTTFIVSASLCSSSYLRDLALQRRAPS